MLLGRTDLPAGQGHGFESALKPESRLVIRLSRLIAFGLNLRLADPDGIAHANVVPPAFILGRTAPNPEQCFAQSINRKGTPGRTLEIL